MPETTLPAPFALAGLTDRVTTVDAMFRHARHSGKFSITWHYEHGRLAVAILDNAKEDFPGELEVPQKR